METSVMPSPPPGPARTLSRLSLVFPVYNEIESLPYLREAVESWAIRHPALAVEVVLVDDGSRDASALFLKQWAESRPGVRALLLSRNFGHQAAVTAGLEHATGEAVVIMDADLQDPLSAIDDMIRAYEAGYDIVYGRRVSRAGETLFKRATAWLYYRALKTMHSGLPLDAGDFRLVSRRCVDAVNALPEKDRFLRGLFAWIGFPQTDVPYEREARHYGVTKYPLLKMLRFAWSGITAFSVLPIRLVSLMGFGAALLSLAYLAYALIAHARGQTVTGWTTIVILQSFFGGCILLAIGVVGEYIGKIFEEVKGRPVYLKRDDIRQHTPGESGRE